MRSRVIGLALAAILLAAGLLSACGGDDAAPSTSRAAPDGAALLEARCTECHTLDRVTSAQETREWWAGTVDRMVTKGAQLSEAEKAALVDFLAETYGP